MSNSIWERTLTDGTGKPDTQQQPDNAYAQRPMEARQLPPQTKPAPDPQVAEQQRAAEQAEFNAWRRSRDEQQNRAESRAYHPSARHNHQTRSLPPVYERRREPLPGKKTYLGSATWIGLGALTMMGVEIPGLQMDTGDSLRMIWEGAMFIFARLGIAKSK